MSKHLDSQETLGQRAEDVTIKWQQKVDTTALNGSSTTLIFSHVHDEGVLQRTELQRRIVVGDKKDARTTSAMALAVRADTAGKVQLHEIKSSDLGYRNLKQILFSG